MVYSLGVPLYVSQRFGGSIMNIKECVVFDGFCPTDDFMPLYLEANCLCREYTFDERVVQYVKDHSNWHAWNKAKYAMRGRPTMERKIGFAGAATVIEVDVDRPWTIKYLNGDVPYAAYLRFETNEDNYAEIYYEE